MRLITAALAASAMLATPVLAPPCKDAKTGKFIKCPPAKTATPARCKDAKGKFAKCGTAGAKPM